MIILEVSGVTKHFGPEPVLADVALDLRAGEKVALVGPNGCGKSTLLKLLAGVEEPDRGSIVWHARTTVGYLEQQPRFAPGATLWQVAQAGLDEIEQLRQQADLIATQMAHADPVRQHELSLQWEEIQQQLHHRRAFDIDHWIEKVLTGLGFHPQDFAQPAELLSGGQKNRLLLAQLLLRGRDVLLLDEPSNHLDLEATEWLERYLTETSQAVILVSHDRYLLDRVADRTLELVLGTVESYSGNFSAYWRQKAERLEVQRRTYEKQQEEIARTEEFIRRNHYGQKAAQAEDRRKKLARIERVAPPREIRGPTMAFPSTGRTGDIVFRGEHLSHRFAQWLFRDLSFDVLRGERWAIMGPNGTGKTTLLRCLAGDLVASEGAIHRGTGLRVGYFDQALTTIADQAVVVEAVRPADDSLTEPQRRDLLARFGITGDLAFQKVSSLSGGERNRVALAKLSGDRWNVLLLDEPTNHLDLWSRASLEKALREFEGTVVFVSHDRYFVDQLADHILVVEPNRFRVVEGNYQVLVHLKKAGLLHEARSKSVDAKAVTPKNSPSEKPDSRAARKKRRFPYRKVVDLEQDIFQREERAREIEALLCTAEVLRDGERVRSLREELQQISDSLPSLYEHWEEAVELNN